MVSSPLANALDVGLAAEVITVLGPRQPASLALAFARLATRGLGTELLVMGVATVRLE
jgi:predicted RNase H-like nuclease (RuvC/YqgF family)